MLVVILSVFILLSCLPDVSPSGPKDSPLNLVLDDKEAYHYTTIEGTVTTTDPEIDSIQVWSKRDGDDNWDVIDLGKGKDNWYELVDKTFSFMINANDFPVGNYLLRAQGIGNSAKSSEKQLEVLEVEITPILELNAGGHNIGDGSYYCTDETVHATYTVDIDFHNDKLKALFNEVKWHFNYSGNKTISRESTTTPDTFESSRVVFNIPSECSKRALLTLEATTNDGSRYTNQTRLDFVLDRAKPDVAISDFYTDPEMRNATMVISASDTKSLGNAYVELFPDKGIQGEGWDKVVVDWGQADFTVGEGERRITGKAEYSPATLGSTITRANATLTFDLADIDGVTMLATAVFNDYSDYGETHGAVAMDSRFFDNTYHQININNIDVPVYSDEYLLTSATDSAIMSIDFIDAFNEQGALQNQYKFHSGSIEILDGSLDISDTTSTTLDVCTGYATKIVRPATLSLQAMDSQESTVYLTVSGTDIYGNTGEATTVVKVDTQAPKLTVVNGHMADPQDYEDDYVKFTFRSADSSQGISFEGATVTVDGNEDTAVWYKHDGEEIKQLDRKNQFKIQYKDTSYALTESGTVTVEIFASDKYGNSDLTEKTGGVSNP